MATGSVARLSSSMAAAGDRKKKDLPASPERALQITGGPDVLGTGAASRLCALVVDDNDDALQILTTVLRYCGALVLGAANASQAERICQVVRPDVIISDLNMPKRTGYDLIRRLRTRAHLGDVPAIAMTAYREQHSVQRARAAGFDEYLEKPIDAFELYALIERLIRRRGHHRNTDP